MKKIDDEYIRITIKQHYIPKVYLKHFEVLNKTKFIFIHNKQDEETLYKGKLVKYESFFWEECIYTDLEDYLKNLKDLRYIFQEEYSKISNNFVQLLEKHLEEYLNLFIEHKKEVKFLIIKALKKGLRKELKEKKKVLTYWAVINMETCLENSYKKYLEKEIFIFIIFIFNFLFFLSNSYQLYLEKSFNEISLFLRENENYTEDINSLKKFSISLNKLIKNLNENTILNDSKIKAAKRKVENRQDKHTLLQKKYAESFNRITVNCLKDFNIIQIKKILKKIYSSKNKKNISLEEKLGKFENNCIFKNLNLEENINFVLDANTIFGITKFILVQIFRFSSSKKINKDILNKILDCNDFSQLKNLKVLKLIDYKGILVKIDKDLFITSDNPVFINQNKTILIFPLTPKLVYLIIEDFNKLIKSNFYQLNFEKNINFIESINYFIIKNGREKIISNKENLTFEKHSIEDFLTECLKILNQ